MRGGSLSQIGIEESKAEWALRNLSQVGNEKNRSEASQKSLGVCARRRRGGL